MPNFEKYAHDGKCEVCGKEARVAVCASTMGPVSLAYCKDCLENGVEPYSFMTAYIASAGEWPDDIRPEAQERVRRLLTFFSKTEEEFSEAVSVLRKADREQA